MTFGSLFAGIGGFDLGLERAGMKCRWQVEIDEYASRVLAKHWPHVTRWGDVRTFPPDNSPEWSVDLICAGVPCQPVSVAGNQKGADDERWLWGEALRVVADIGPRFFVAENPTGILHHDGGRTFGGLLRALTSVGYMCEWHSIPAAGIGAPHKRDRVWLICSRRDVQHGHGLQLHAEASEVPDADGGRLQIKRLKEPRGIQGPCRSEFDGLCEVRQFTDSTGGPDHWWFFEPCVGRVADGVPCRVDRLRCLGNAVVPQIVELIGRAIIEHDAARTAAPQRPRRAR